VENMSEPSVILRRATITDAALIAEIGDRTFSDTFADDNQPDDMAAYLASSFSPALQHIFMLGADAQTDILMQKEI